MKNLAILVAVIGMIAAACNSESNGGKQGAKANDQVENTTGGGLFESRKAYMGEWIMNVPALNGNRTVKIYKQGDAEMYEFRATDGKITKLVLHKGEDGIMYTIDKYGSRRDVVYDEDKDVLVVSGFSGDFKRLKRQ